MAYNAATNTIDTGTQSGGVNIGSTPFVAAQAQTAANQGKPGFDTFGNSLSGNAQITANQNAAAKLGVSIPGVNGALNQSTTTLSSDKSKDIANIQGKTDKLSQTGVTTDPTTGVATHADGSIYNPGDTNDPIEAPANGISNGGYVGETYYPAGAKLPVDSTGNFSPTTASSPTDVKILNSLNDQKAQNDALTASIISSIQNQYSQLISKQQEANNAQQGGETQLLLRNGGLQHTGSGQNVLSSVVSYGISQLADLNNKEQMAVLSAQQAGQQQDFQLQDKMNQQASDIRDKKIAAAQKINDDIATENNKLADRAYQESQDKIKAIQGIATDAAKNGASPDTIKAITSSQDVESAISAAGDSLQTASGTLGDYLQYKRDAVANGLTPKDYQTYKDDQDAKQLRDDVSKASQIAYATENAKNQSDANSTESDKVQQKLEQQYRGVLSKEFSSRTGALGIENAKVNQANHLDSLLTQYYDPKTGNYNVPKSQYAELVTGLANLISPTGAANESTIKDLNSYTSKSDLNGALQYLTNSPQNGNTQAMIKNIVDSVDRQAQTATSNREAALQNLRDQAPTDLDPARVDALNKSTQMVEYTGQDRISKKNVDDFLNTGGSQTVQMPDGPHSMYYAVSELYKIPGATNKDVEDYLKANGYIQ